VEKEYDEGFDALPPATHKWFQQSKEQLLAQTTEYKKGWLVIVKSIKLWLSVRSAAINVRSVCSLKSTSVS
jgi:hypothetical protein